MSDEELACLVNPKQITIARARTTSDGVVYVDIETTTGTVIHCIAPSVDAARMLCDSLGLVLLQHVRTVNLKG